jgi:hypothetical protein
MISFISSGVVFLAYQSVLSTSSVSRKFFVSTAGQSTRKGDMGWINWIYLPFLFSHSYTFL